RVVGRAELLRPPAGQGLALVAACEEGELSGIARTDRAQPAGGEVERLVPADGLELAAAALADALQRRRQPRRRMLVHDSGGTLGADDAAVHRMVGIAVDVADLVVLEMHPDPAAARAHVARRRRDPVVRLRNGLGAGMVRRNGSARLARKTTFAARCLRVDGESEQTAHCRGMLTPTEFRL